MKAGSARMIIDVRIFTGVARPDGLGPWMLLARGEEMLVLAAGRHEYIIDA